ncbi:tyrosine-type recombinase/integrase [Roseateles koreensis]|uniref:Integrase arm-type DNA-binding domain-containing protein n=1 Tax=Roseateles koreensis TaxID=2987526 RepID=A0ABT5KMC0_9BURK|nr:site-specific integrase [Roseateles koreensis]MDC8783575.1 integrase arm-type DNA-binding domain-containing protein [Roseateles koreensis]
MAKLSDRLIKAAKGEGKDQFLGDGGGLYLRVTPVGTKVWMYRFKNATNQTKWLDLGTYPSKSLAEARADATSLKVKRREGIDPVEERARLADANRAAEAESKAKLAAFNARMKVQELYERWIALEISKRKDQGAGTRRMFEKDVLPDLGEMAVEDVRKGHIAAVVDKVLARGGNGRMAALVLSSMRQMLRFAVERDVIDGDPTATICKSRIHKPTERERVLSAEELAILIARLPNAGLCESSQLAVLAMLSTCCRVGELSKANLKDLDLDKATWRIPAENSKNKREHIVALSDFSIGVMRTLKDRADRIGSEWLLPARNKLDPHKKPLPVCEKSLSKQIGDRQRPGQKPMKGRSPLVDALVLAGGKWTAHDLRRTGATLMGELGVRPDVIERCLNHTEQDRMKRTYQRHSYQEEMRAAWSLLGDRLALISCPQANITVLPMRAA